MEPEISRKEKMNERDVISCYTYFSHPSIVDILIDVAFITS